MRTSESISNISAALAKFQSEVKQPKKDTNNPFFNKKYVPLEGVVSVITEPLAKNGLSYIQSTGTEGENVIVTTLLMHTSGEFIESDPLRLPGHQVQKGGGKDFNPQGIGSAITYGRRYSLTALLGIASEEDDDGNSGSQNEQPTGGNKTSSHGNGNQTDKRSDAQVKRLFAIAKDKGVSVADVKKALMKDYNKTQAEDLTKKEYDELCARLEAAGKEQKNAE